MPDRVNFFGLTRRKLIAFIRSNLIAKELRFVTSE